MLPQVEALIGAGEASTADLFPYLLVLGVGFLVAAWGKSLGSAIAIVAGLLLVIAAIVGFIIEFPTCPSGTRCF